MQGMYVVSSTHKSPLGEGSVIFSWFQFSCVKSTRLNGHPQNIHQAEEDEDDDVILFQTNLHKQRRAFYIMNIVRSRTNAPLLFTKRVRAHIQFFVY